MSTIGEDNPFLSSNPRSHQYNKSIEPPINGRFAIPESSPLQEKRALESRLEDVTKRIREAQKAGENLERQRQAIQEMLIEVETEAANGGELGTELKAKLSDLEKEYEEVHRESARILVSSKKAESPYRQSTNASTYQSQGSGSPTKLTVPSSRRQRNQPSRAHDLQFSVEIANNLIVEVRKLQAALAERDQQLNALKEEKADLERTADALQLQIRHLEQNEVKYREENWDLMMKIQTYEDREKERTEVETRLQTQIANLIEEKDYSQQELEELRQTFSKNTDDNEAIIQHHEGELAKLQRNLAVVEADRDGLKKQLEDLKQELKDSSMRLKYAHDELANHKMEQRIPVLAPTSYSPESSPPPSPTKATPRHGALQSETLKSSLNHAHRMIANLKSNINREKSEKQELKRMLTEAREELEKLRADVGTPGSTTKRRKAPLRDIKIKKPARPDLLGALRRPKSEVEEFAEPMDVGWEDDSEATPTSRRELGSPIRRYTAESGMSGFETAQETTLDTDAAFETAHEEDDVKDYPTSADDSTETEGPVGSKVSSKGSRGRKAYSGLGAFEPSKKKSLTPLAINRVRDRNSIVSVGSGDEDDQDGFKFKSFESSYVPDSPDRDELDPQSPVQLSQQKLKIRIRSGRGKLGSRIPSDGSIFGLNQRYSREQSPTAAAPPAMLEDSTANRSRMSSVSSSVASFDHGRVMAGNSLFAELGGSFGGISGENEDTEEDEDAIVHDSHTPTRDAFGSSLLPVMKDVGCNTEETYAEPVVFERPMTPLSRPVMVDGDTQSTPVQMPVLIESWTQATPVQKPVLAGSATQSTPARVLVLSESGTQSTPARMPILVETGAQSTPSRMAESGTQFTPAQRPIMANRETQATPLQRPILTESWTQATPLRKIIFAESGTQATPVRTPVLSESGTQFTPAPQPVLVDSNTQSTPVKRPVYVNSIMQSLEIPKLGSASAAIQSDPPFTTSGVQSKETKKVPITLLPAAEITPRLSVHSSIEAQPNEESWPPSASSGTQGQEESKPEMVAASTQAGLKVTEEMIDCGTQFDLELDRVPEATPAIPEMIETGTQYEAELDANEEAQVSITAEMKAEAVDVGTQFDAEIESAGIASSEFAAVAAPAETEVLQLPEFAMSIIPVANLDPLEPEEVMTFSSIQTQDTVPVEPKLPTPPAITPTVAATEQTASSDEDTPKKVSESLERQRPTTPSPHGGPSFLDALFRKARASDAIDGSESTATTSEMSRDVADLKGKAKTRASMFDQSVQTAIGSEYFDKPAEKPVKPILVGISATNFAPMTSGLSECPKSPATRASQESLGRSKRVTVADYLILRRPGSSSSAKEYRRSQPPLPPDHKEQIAAAQSKQFASLEPSLAMGPPTLPASATKNSVSFTSRPKTPTHPPRSESAMSKTLHPRGSRSRSEVSSHRSSISSFASELDDRFRLHEDAYLGRRQEPQTDPKVIQAITQAMIGEYLWKYTRNTTKQGLSQYRHRRFFWAHPYTRTLYWSDQDPATAGRHELRAKSVSIESVHVIADDNPMPPGLHRKSLVVITPGRTLKFTAPTGQRHETWYTALSHILARAPPGNDEEDGEPDVSDFDPYNGPRSASAMSSYQSRTARNPSPIRNASSLSNRRPPPQQATQSSVSSRISSIFRPERFGGTFSTRGSRHASGSMYNTTDVNDSAEDLRQEIERQEMEGMENVRACCDGKHDVGTLSRKTQGFGSRKSYHHHSHSSGSAADHTHNHNHARS